MALTTREAVVKSGVLRLNTRCPSPPNFTGTSRSTLAPLGMRPPLGTFTEIFEPSLPDDAEAAHDHAALGEGVHLPVDAAHRCHEKAAAPQARGVADGAPL